MMNYDMMSGGYGSGMMRLPMRSLAQISHAFTANAWSLQH